MDEEEGASSAPQQPPLPCPLPLQALVRATPPTQPGFDPAPLIATVTSEVSSSDKATRRWGALAGTLA